MDPHGYIDNFQPKLENGQNFLQEILSRLKKRTGNLRILEKEIFSPGCLEMDESSNNIQLLSPFNVTGRRNRASKSAS